MVQVTRDKIIREVIVRHCFMTTVFTPCSWSGSSASHTCEGVPAAGFEAATNGPALETHGLERQQCLVLMKRALRRAGYRQTLGFHTETAALNFMALTGHILD